MWHRYSIAFNSQPTLLPEGLALGGVTEREDARDAVVLALRHAGAGWRDLGDLPPGSVVGSSSLRREAYVRARYPHLQVVSVRGNLQTRLAKLDGSSSNGSSGGTSAGADMAATDDPAKAGTTAAAGRAAGWAAAPASATGAEGQAPPPGPPQQAQAQQQSYDVLLLAAAGLHRLGWGPRVSWYLPLEDGGSAVGQGALGLECRSGDRTVQAMLRAVSHGPTLAAVAAERAFLRQLQGGCQVPIAVHTRVEGGGKGAAPSEEALRGPPQQWATLSISGSVTAIDGGESVTAQASGVVPVWGPGGRREGGLAATDTEAAEEADWTAAVEAAAAVGRALAQRALDGGAGRILGPLTAARPLTYGAAEVRLD